MSLNPNLKLGPYDILSPLGAGGMTAYRSPWQSPYVERLIGSIRRECLDHCIILNERHLRRIHADSLDYYHESRPPLSLNGNAPLERKVKPPEEGEDVSIPQVGGLSR